MDENLQENKELNTENIPEDIVIGIAEETKETAGKKPKVKREMCIRDRHMRMQVFTGRFLKTGSR